MSLDDILQGRRKPKRKVVYEGLDRRVKVWENAPGSYINAKNKLVGKTQQRRPGSQNPTKGSKRKRVL